MQPLCEIYTDAAFDPQTGFAGLAFEIVDALDRRNHDDVRGIVSWKPLSSSEEAELQAINFSLGHFTRAERQTQIAAIYCDNAAVVALLNDKTNLEHRELPIRDAVALVKKQLSNIAVKKIGRTDNAVADAEAKRVLREWKAKRKTK